MSKRKRKVFDIKEKAHIIWRLESGETNNGIAKEYAVSHSTISTIWKDKERIKKTFEENNLKIKRARTTEHNDIDQALLKWFKHQRSNNIPISGPILQEKTNDFARQLGKENFKCSSSWVQRFRLRHSIVSGKISGEAADVPIGTKEEWLSQKWPILCQGYKPEDIFNADELGLFYNMTPDKTLKFKGDKCTGGKLSKRRITVMAAANMTGSYYENNNKSWMTSKIFEKWLRNWDSQLQLQKRKILLVVDNCPAHCLVENLEYIKVVFLPPNITSVLQPLDQGVIKSLKMHYRKLLVINLLQRIEKKEEEKFTILDAIFMISQAWQNVTQRTIANCFKHAGFIDPSVCTLIDKDEISPASEKDNVSLLQLGQALTPPLTALDVEEFLQVDNNIAVCSSLSDQEILEEIKNLDTVIEDHDELENEEGNFVIPTISGALSAITVLQKFVLGKEEYCLSNNNESLNKMSQQIQQYDAQFHSFYIFND
ncbi:tigger transposable element-derived protein 4-like [Microplitis mediator]|uniref:tigger transposable element-derived protein 4-like n=1 Tax=Microplitis mediator TaxID=375433 RepID=UPI0025529B74|nr:tigger transposable element-derived protein 4-like [Microplitis mediator]